MPGTLSSCELPFCGACLRTGALLQVGAQPHARVQSGEERVLHDDAGQREDQVFVRGVGDRAAEDVREQQHEHHRLDAEVHQLERVVLDLDQGAPGQREGLLYPLDGADPGGQRRHGDRHGCCAHRALLSLGTCMSWVSGAPSAASSSARWPVSDRNTPSRLEPRKVSSAISTPASSSCRTTAGSTAGSGTGAVTIVLLTSGAASVNSVTMEMTAGRSTGWVGRTARICAPVRALSSCGVPVAITVPWSTTAISIARWSASSRYCVVSSTVTPVAVRPRTMSHISL